MAFSKLQKFLIIILSLAVISGAALLGYRAKKEYPKFVLTPEIEEPVSREPVAPRPLVETAKTPIRRLNPAEKERFKEVLKININTASIDQLQKLPGIGPKTAEKIIAHRPYKKIRNITRVPRIGEKTFEKLKGSITVSGKGVEDYKSP